MKRPYHLIHQFVCLAGALLLALVVLSPIFVAPLPVQAQATITVTNGNDSGPGSLREAITAAQPGDTITFDSSVATVTLTSAQLTISTMLTIDGGTTGVTIARSDEAGTPDFRIFDITGGDVTLESLTIRNGNVSGTSSGGGIFNSGTLAVTNSSISGNTAGANGGGIANTNGGTLTVTNSSISGNTTGEDGGGIFNNADGAVTVTNSTLSGNTASNNDGGGIANNSGVVVVTGSMLSGNTSGFDGAGIDNLDELTVINSTLSGNTARDDGGGISNNDELTMTNSTLSGNTARDDGGGIDNKGNGTVNVTTSTLSGNTASDGGGIFANSGTVTVTNSTLSGNEADDGGGIFNTNSGTVTLANSIVANNTDRGSDNDVQNTATLTVLGSNIIEIAVRGTAADTTNGTITNTDPALGPLQDNGGSTRTHLPQAGSPAIDAGDNTVATNAGLTTDQRGFARIVNTTADIGAVEVGGGDIAYRIALDPTSVTEGDSGTTDATVTIARTGGISATSSVDVGLDGTATEGSDYSFGPASGSSGSFDGTTLSFAAGETETTFTITVQGDDLAEGDETVEVTLANPTAPETATITGDNPVTLSIQDDDGANVLIAPTELTVTEGGGTATYTIALTSRPSADVTVTIAPDAQLSTDATTLTFTPADWALSQTVTVSAVDDSAVEGMHSGMITHSVGNSDGAYAGISIAAVTVTIQDNDEAGEAPTDSAIYLPLILR
jgi:hypothetical protein